MTAIKWRVYYSDSSTFDSEQGEPKDAPGMGVIVIVQRDADPRVGSYLAHRGDYYFWMDERWFACDREGVWQYLYNNKFDHEKVSLMGQSAGNERYETILREAKMDKDFYG